MRCRRRNINSKTSRRRDRWLLLLLLFVVIPSELLPAPLSFYCVVDAAFSSSSSVISSRIIIDTSTSTAVKATISKPADEQYNTGDAFHEGGDNARGEEEERNEYQGGDVNGNIIDDADGGQAGQVQPHAQEDVVGNLVAPVAANTIPPSHAAPLEMENQKALLMSAPQPEEAADKKVPMVSMTLSVIPLETVANLLASRVAAARPPRIKVAAAWVAPVVTKTIPPSHATSLEMENKIISLAAAPRPQEAADKQDVPKVPTTPTVKSLETVANLLASRVAAARPRRIMVPAAWLAPVVAKTIPPSHATPLEMENKKASLVSGNPLSKLATTPPLEAADKQVPKVPKTLGPPVKPPIVAPVKPFESVANLLASRVAAAVPRRVKVPAAWLVAAPVVAKPTTPPINAIGQTPPVLKKDAAAEAQTVPAYWWAKDTFSGKIFEYCIKNGRLPLDNWQSVTRVPLFGAAPELKQLQGNDDNDEEEDVRSISLPMAEPLQQQQVH